MYSPPPGITWIIEDTDHRAPSALLNVRQVRGWSHRSHWAPWARLSWRAWHARESRTPLGSWWACNQEHLISAYSIIKTNTESRRHFRYLSCNSALCLVAFKLRCSWKFKLNTKVTPPFCLFLDLFAQVRHLRTFLVPQPLQSSRDLPDLPL